MSLRLFALTTLLVATNMVSTATATATATEGVEKPSATPISGTDTVHGCYTSLGDMVLNVTDNFNTQGSCNIACRGMGKSVGASQQKKCYCGDDYPPLNTLTNDAACGEPCPGYGPDACGGLNTYTVYNTGLNVQVADSANVTTSSTTVGSDADATSTQAAVVTVSGTVLVTQTPAASSSSGSNTVGIAVGVVVGILAVAGISGAGFFFMRRRRNAEIEDEHRRNAAVNAFISGGKPPSSSGGLSISDQRLDPVMAQRRMSSGSIADDQDYSRRILRVTNA